MIYLVSSVDEDDEARIDKQLEWIGQPCIHDWMSWCHYLSRGIL